MNEGSACDQAPKLLAKALRKNNRLRFAEMTALAKAFGFAEVRVRGSHHIFNHPKVAELLNLQDVDGQAKPYQVRQFLDLGESCNLSLREVR